MCDAPFIDSSLTPANGYYYFNFTAHKGCSYQVVAVKRTHYWDMQPEGVIEGTKNEIYLKMDPVGYLRIFVKNVPPANDSDTIIVYADGGGGINKYYFGKDVDKIFISGVYAKRFCLIIWFYTVIKPRIAYKDSVYIPPFDTANYYLNFYIIHSNPL